MRQINRIFTAATLFTVVLAGAAAETVDLEAVHRIRAEAFENSQVADHVFQLTDVNGPRITNSPGYDAAAAWCQRRMKEIGLVNVAAEAFEFGKGWSYSRFSIHLVEPAVAVLNGFPLAWTPGTNGPLTAEPVLAVIEKEEDIEKFKGKLKGKIVLLDKPREITLSTEPLGRRYSEQDLTDRALAEAPRPKPEKDPDEDREKRTEFRKKLLQFLTDEGAAAVLRISYKGEAGLVAGTSGGSHKTDWPVPPPMAALSAEHYNRIVRLLKKEIPVKIEIDIAARFHEDNLEAENVIGEIRGASKPNEVVMLGGHLDSWHGGTGAVDNAAGVAIAIEAARILKKLNLPLARTVRAALWAGEEQGLLGSRAYVTRHFADRDDMKLKPEHAGLQAYFNFDNGSGKIRGIYLQGNDMLRPIFAAWLEPFHDLGATTVTIRNTSSTDHVPFDQAGLPGFQFIQEPLEYSPRTHHSNADVYDHVIESDLMQASAVMASLVYHAANRDEMLPRKPLPEAKKTGKKKQ